MRGAHRLGIVLAACAALAGCAARRESREAPAPPATARLAALMEGRFSSAAQAARDPDYRDIRLSMTRIWSDRDDGPWLFVEQAVAGQAPYRRRVYRLVARADGAIESAVFTFPDSAVPGTVRFGDLVPRVGCSVILQAATGGTFTGGTRGTRCPSELRGASYATSEVVIGPDGMKSWDRGFDAAGRQVWGAEKGGYEFLRER